MDFPNPLNTNELPGPSAVVVLHEKATDSLILTQRSMHLSSHPGDICFPGGYWQVGDTSLWETALRELREELGIAPNRVELLKKLQPEQTLSGCVIYPWFASINTLIPYSANVREVAAVLTIPMPDVLSSANYKDIVLNREGEMISSAQFTACDYFVWGATVRIMKQLLNRTPS